MKACARYLIIFGLVWSLFPLAAGYANEANRHLDLAAFEAVTKEAHNFTMPGEFEPIESVWLAYPVYENRKGFPSTDVQAPIIQALAPHVYIDLLVQNEEDQQAAREWIATLGIPNGCVRYHLIPHTDIWIRDMGPIFLSNRKGDLKIADFGFSEWSYSRPSDPAAMIDERVDRLVAHELDLPIVRANVISEGGDREFNGKGTLLVTEAVEMQRNPGMSKQEIETEFKRVFNVSNVIWLKQGLADDDLTYKGMLPGNVLPVMTTGGHIDEYARFVNASTILLTQVSEKERNFNAIDAISYQRMEENYRILKNAVDQDGKSFNIVRVPIAKPIYVTLTDQDEVYQFLKNIRYDDGTVIKEGEPITIVIAASYLNFLMANEVVLVPKYWNEGRDEEYKKKDEAVQKIFEHVFPNRRIIRINPENVNAGGGGMHCISQQMPKRATVR